MSHLSDKELDRLSREAAEQFDVEGSASGWDALEKKLDKDLPVDGPKPKKRRIAFWYWFTGALLLVGLTVAFYSYYNTVDRVNPALSNVTPGTKNKEAAAETKIPKAIENSENPVATADKSATNSNQSSPDKKDNDLSIQKRETTIFSKRAQRYNERRSFIGSTTRKKNSPSANEMQANEDGQQEEEPPLLNVDPVSITHEEHIFYIPDSTHADSLIALLAAQKPERDTNVKSNTVFPWEIGMLVGADKSNVNFNGSFKTGFNYGIHLGYRFSKRWSVNTGFVFDKKFYIAKGKDFHPPKGYWTDYVKLDKVSGNCTMWEIPLNLRYDLSLTRKGYWFASAGLSTYLMQQEDYDYYYWQNGNYLNRHRGYPSDEKAIMGVLNISGGFEKNFTPHVSIQIEPYMRVPLKGVGFGKMQMNSFGTNVILKFKGGKAMH